MRLTNFIQIADKDSGADMDNQVKNASSEQSTASPEIAPESSEIFHTAVERGYGRLNRRRIDMGVSGFIAGMNVTFGALAAAAVTGAVQASIGTQFTLFAEVMGAIVFPIGFILVIIGRSELFTENFLVPTAAVLAHKSKLRSLATLWSLTLAGNLLGAFVVAKMMSLEHYHGVPAAETIAHIHHVADFLVLERDWDASFISGIFAGWLITLMTLLLLTTDNVTAKIAVIGFVGFLIMLNKFNHIVVNSAEIFMAIFTGDDKITYWAWFKNSFAPTLLGNIIGGLVFVTLLEYVKVIRLPEKWR